MAITKIHPIKSTLKKAIDYIADPAKTDDKLLVSSFGCAVETADLEFEKTRLLAMQKGNNLAHHLIQAFEPGEVSYAQAHEIGRQLADEILGGKYEYVIATHINKEHCHNHIIFCAVDFAEHKKYISNRKSYAHIRRVSDRLCRENGLSVVAPGAERGKQYAEWDAQRKGTSYKQKLKIAIDRLIPISKDLDDLLRRLEAEGYEIKRGKYISFRAPSQERFTRAKTLGEAYTEEAIAERIKGKVILKMPKPERSGVSLLIDIENCIKAQQSAGYERWAKIENLKRAARTMVFLDQHGISHYTDLEQKITVLQDSNEQTAAALKAAERRLSDLALLIKHTATYKELKPLYSEYKKSRDKEKYLREEYFSDYRRYQLMQVDKTRVLLACRVIINDLLGKLYLTGNGIPKDEETAWNCFRMANAYGHPYARYVLERQEQWQRPELLLTVSRLLYHMSNIFRDNAPAVPAQPRLHIDRKRMQELQEMRIALGHQPDDHEEEQTQTWGGMTMKGW